jgi:hypothetical protein
VHRAARAFDDVVGGGVEGRVGGRGGRGHLHIDAADGSGARGGIDRTGGGGRACGLSGGGGGGEGRIRVRSTGIECDASRCTAVVTASRASGSAFIATERARRCHAAFATRSRKPRTCAVSLAGVSRALWASPCSARSEAT